MVGHWLQVNRPLIGEAVISSPTTPTSEEEKETEGRIGYQWSMMLTLTQASMMGVSMAMPKEMIWSFQVGKQEQIHNSEG